MIVPWFSSFVEDFVISCNQITKLFSLRYCFASASSSRNPCHFGSQACFAILVIWELSLNIVLPWISLLRWTLLFPEFFTRRIVAFENLTLSFDPNLPLSRRIDFLWGLSWDTRTQLNGLFQNCHRSFCATYLWILFTKTYTCHHTCLRTQTCDSSTQ